MSFLSTVKFWHGTPTQITDNKVIRYISWGAVINFLSGSIFRRSVIKLFWQRTDNIHSSQKEQLFLWHVRLIGDEVKVDDAHVLAQYQLANWGTENRRSVMPAEQLFLEAGMNFLKPGGFMGVVLPDGILNNPGLAFLRDWLIRRSRVIASIALPKETFGRNGGVNNPSVLIVQKFTHAEYLNADKGIIDTNGDVFMCAPVTSGIDKRGGPVFLRHPNGEFILDEKGERVADDQIAMVPVAYELWRNSTSRSPEVSRAGNGVGSRI